MSISDAKKRLNDLAAKHVKDLELEKLKNQPSLDNEILKKMSNQNEYLRSIDNNLRFFTWLTIISMVLWFLFGLFVSR